MKTNWDLNALYTGFDTPEIQSDLAQVLSFDEKYIRFKSETLSHYNHPIQQMEMFIKNYAEDYRLLTRLLSFATLKSSLNAADEDAAALDSKTRKALPALTVAIVDFTEWLKGVDGLDQLISQSDILKDHAFFLEELLAQAEHTLPAEEEKIIATLTTTGSTAWERLQRKLSSQLTVDVPLDGEVKNLPIMAVRNLAYSADPETRKAGYFAELKAYESHAESSAAALNGIKGEVLSLCTLHHFKDPLEETLFNSRMKPEILEAMIGAMEEYLPVFRRYLKAKAKFLGHSEGLPFYDLFAPISTADRNFTEEEARDYIVSNFASFSPDLSALADRAFESGWLDFEPRAGKSGGAFCSNLASIGESRVLLNFTGKLKNVFTIAHELGHAFHGDRIMKDSILNTHYPMPLAETASIFCETIVRNAVLATADQSLQRAILESSLQSATQVVVDILSRYYFETAVFEARKDHPLSVEELKALMLDAQERAYGDGLDPEFRHPFMWLNKTHYYYAKRNFYNFPYAFGQLFSLGLYAQFLEKGEAFVAQYDQFLKHSGKMNIYDVCMEIGIDPTDRAFWRQSLDQIKADVETFERALC